MLVDIETDRKVRSILFALYGDANLASLGIEGIPVGVPNEAIRWLPTAQDSAERQTGSHQKSALQPDIHPADITSEMSIA